MGTVFPSFRLKLTGGEWVQCQKIGQQGALGLSGQVTFKRGQGAGPAEWVNQSRGERCRSLQSAEQQIKVVSSHKLLTLSVGLRGVIWVDEVQ